MCIHIYIYIHTYACIYIYINIYLFIFTCGKNLCIYIYYLNSIPNCHVVERSSQCHLFLDSSSIGGAFAGLYCGGAGWMGNQAWLKNLPFFHGKASESRWHQWNFHPGKCGGYRARCDSRRLWNSRAVRAGAGVAAQCDLYNCDLSMVTDIYTKH